MRAIIKFTGIVEFRIEVLEVIGKVGPDVDFILLKIIAHQAIVHVEIKGSAGKGIECDFAILRSPNNAIGHLCGHGINGSDLIYIDIVVAE